MLVLPKTKGWRINNWPIVAFRSAKGRAFAERKPTLVSVRFLSLRAKKMRMSRFFQQPTERRQLLRRQMPQRLPVQFLQWFIDFCQSVDRLVCDRHINHAPVMIAALALDEAAALQPIDQSGDTR